MRYKLTYVYSNSYKKFTQIFSSNLLLKVILKYVRKNLRVINIEISKHYWYARVNFKEQNLNRQIEALTKYVVNESDITTDKQSEKDFNRKKDMKY